jgi:hypothetical protein
MIICGRDDLLFAFSVSMNMMKSSPMILFSYKVDFEERKCHECMESDTSKAEKNVGRSERSNKLRQLCLIIPTCQAKVLDRHLETGGSVLQQLCFGVGNSACFMMGLAS